MDDFQVILGMEFLHTAKVVPMPFLGSICMIGEEGNRDRNAKNPILLDEILPLRLFDWSLSI